MRLFEVKLQSPVGTADTVYVRAHTGEQACRQAMRNAGTGWLPIYALEV